MKHSRLLAITFISGTLSFLAFNRCFCGNRREGIVRGTFVPPSVAPLRACPQFGDSGRVGLICDGFPVLWGSVAQIA